MDPNEVITLGNVCGGAVEELFQRELDSVPATWLTGKLGKIPIIS